MSCLRPTPTEGEVESATKLCRQAWEANMTALKQARAKAGSTSSSSNIDNKRFVDEMTTKVIDALNVRLWPQIQQLTKVATLAALSGGVRRGGGGETFSDRGSAIGAQDMQELKSLLQNPLGTDKSSGNYRRMHRAESEVY